MKPLVGMLKFNINVEVVEYNSQLISKDSKSSSSASQKPPLCKWFSALSTYFWYLSASLKEHYNYKSFIVIKDVQAPWLVCGNSQLKKPLPQGNEALPLHYTLQNNFILRKLCHLFDSLTPILQVTAATMEQNLPKQKVKTSTNCTGDSSFISDSSQLQ